MTTLYLDTYFSDQAFRVCFCSQLYTIEVRMPVLTLASKTLFERSYRSQDEVAKCLDAPATFCPN
jgi:hypothetical protein